MTPERFTKLFKKFTECQTGAYEDTVAMHNIPYDQDILPQPRFFLLVECENGVDHIIPMDSEMFPSTDDSIVALVKFKALLQVARAPGLLPQLFNAKEEDAPELKRVLAAGVACEARTRGKKDGREIEHALVVMFEDTDYNSATAIYEKVGEPGAVKLKELEFEVSQVTHDPRETGRFQNLFGLEPREAEEDKVYEH